MIFIQLEEQLKSLVSLIEVLSDQQYNHRISHLGNASIGGHTRHIIELLQCAMNGYETGLIDYVNRERNLNLQLDRNLACSTIKNLLLEVTKQDKIMDMYVETLNEFQTNSVSTTFYREIVYNTEHTIHHLALIKVALIEMNLQIVNDDFGMAYSTIKYNLISSKQLN